MSRKTTANARRALPPLTFQGIQAEATSQDPPRLKYLQSDRGYLTRGGVGGRAKGVPSGLPDRVELRHWWSLRGSRSEKGYNQWDMRGLHSSCRPSLPPIRPHQGQGTVPKSYSSGLGTRASIT